MARTKRILKKHTTDPVSPATLAISGPLEQLLSQQAELTQQIDALKREERAQVVAHVRKQVGLFYFTSNELGLGKAGKKQQKKSGAIAKYRDPVSGATWSGRGKPPRWIAGKERAGFLIE